MAARAIDTVMRDVAAGVSRRTSLLTLGGAALAAAVAKPDVSEAKKKKSGDKCKKKEKQRCSNDAATCRLLLPGGCQGDPDCIALLTPCCDSCSSSKFLSCFLAAQQP
jgi:hypothetical protein